MNHPLLEIILFGHSHPASSKDVSRWLCPKDSRNLARDSLGATQVHSGGGQAT